MLQDNLRTRSIDIIQRRITQQIAQLYTCAPTATTATMTTQSRANNTRVHTNVHSRHVRTHARAHAHTCTQAREHLNTKARRHAPRLSSVEYRASVVATFAVAASSRVRHFVASVCISKHCFIAASCCNFRERGASLCADSNIL